MSFVNEAVLRAMARLQAHGQDEEGQGLAEYGLILALIAVVCIAALTALGTNVAAKLQAVAGAIGG